MMRKGRVLGGGRIGSTKHSAQNGRPTVVRRDLSEISVSHMGVITMERSYARLLLRNPSLFAWEARCHRISPEKLRKACEMRR